MEEGGGRREEGGGRREEGGGEKGEVYRRPMEEGDLDLVIVIQLVLQCHIEVYPVVVVVRLLDGVGRGGYVPEGDGGRREVRDLLGVEVLLWIGDGKRLVVQYV
jgi:hypothetical protein